ncbi:hypothetical protein CTA2_8965 [Colletotrichum tanaceti]|uniref:Uncharacterized protein n=1 Tax=Colletotrichum tanaceti TaxID=1306861 RepID=A0A4U6XU12_9PEZI|nr:hypothetical protein CTA2_8965 [Colletotrichum tanaceti]TKW59388.1 hypothetical protein CTA1_10215 [Colletotrichum tanaceti]
MFASIILTSLVAAGSVRAGIADGSWGIRADFTQCNRGTPVEAVLSDAKGQHSPNFTPSPGIAEFKITSPYNGTLVIKVAGAADFGSPYQPQQVGLQVFAEPTTAGGQPGVWANATVTPGQGQPVPVAQISWDSITNGEYPLATGQIDNNKAVSLETTVNGATLDVFYCVAPYDIEGLSGDNGK